MEGSASVRGGNQPERKRAFPTLLVPFSHDTIRCTWRFESHARWTAWCKGGGRCLRTGTMRMRSSRRGRRRMPSRTRSAISCGTLPSGAKRSRARGSIHSARPRGQSPGL